MSNYTTTNDLLLDVLWRAYEKTDGSSQFADAALRYLNRAYRSLWTGGGEFLPTKPIDWWWMKEAATITLLPYFNTGTISVTQGSDIASLSTPPSISLQGYWLMVDGANVAYQVTTHAAADVGIILDSIYNETSAATATFKALPLDYALPSDCLKVLDPLWSQNLQASKIPMASMSEMWAAYPLMRITQNIPTLFAPIDETAIRFSHFVDTYVRIDFEYMKVYNDLTTDPSSVPLLPLNYRHVLADMATGLVMLDKEDSRAASTVEQAKAGIAGMQAENRKRWSTASEIGTIFPRQPTRSRRPWWWRKP